MTDAAALPQVLAAGALSGAPPPSVADVRRIILDSEPLAPLLERDRSQAVADLEAENVFQPSLPTAGDPQAPADRSVSGERGPFLLRLSIAERRLAFDIRRLDDTPLRVVALALGPFRGLIRDYQMIVDSYADAVAEGREARIQAIDMGRRGVHNEGAQLMIDRLAGKIAIDFDTARRLFTLLCVLHQRV